LLNTFQHNINHFNEAEQLANYAKQQLKKKLIQHRKGNYFISILKLQNQPGWKTLLDALLSDFGFSHKQTEEVIKMLQSQSGKQIENTTYRLIKDREFLIISEANTENNSEAIVLIENEKQKVKTPFFKLKFEVVNFKGIQHKSPEWFMQLDYHKISFPLTLRKWQRGDYFYPLGMNKKKKISDFLVNEKVSVLDKEQTYVLLSGEHIIAVLGKRIDDRFKVTNATQKALEIVLKKD
jgi:tRNA(Ile)-lysidine synthase